MWWFSSWRAACRIWQRLHLSSVWCGTSEQESKHTKNDSLLLLGIIDTLNTVLSYQGTDATSMTKSDSGLYFLRTSTFVNKMTKVLMIFTSQYWNSLKLYVIFDSNVQRKTFFFLVSKSTFWTKSKNLVHKDNSFLKICQLA
jgi:hypothetical protein